GRANPRAAGSGPSPYRPQDTRSAPLLLLEVAGGDERELVGFEVAPERGVHLRRGEGGDLRLEVDVPREGALHEQVRAQAVGERAVLRARHAPLLEQRLLAGLDLLGAEAVAHRACELLADRALDAAAVLRREDRADAKAPGLVEGAGVEAAERAVGQAFLLAHAP